MSFKELHIYEGQNTSKRTWRRLYAVRIIKEKNEDFLGMDGLVSQRLYPVHIKSSVCSAGAQCVTSEISEVG